MSGQKIEKQYVSRSFYCSVCKKMHKVKLKWSLLKNQKFPFQYIYFHGNDEGILTTLYLDANLNIRGAESLDLATLEGNYLSQKKSNEIMKKLAKELFNVRREYKELNERYKELYDDEWISLKCQCLACKALFQINYKAVCIDELKEPIKL